MADSYRIIVVDDDPGILKFFRFALSGPHDDLDGTQSLNPEHMDRGGLIGNASIAYELVCCDTAVKAVGAVEKSITKDVPVAVAFIDIRLGPGHDGIWAAKRIRAVDPNIEIVIMSAFSDYTPEKIIGLIPPVQKLFYLQKPFKIREIFYFTNILCAKWEKERVLCREAEASLQASEERFSLLVKNVIFGMCIIRDDRVVYTSPELHNMSGSPFDSFQLKNFHQEDITKIKRFYQKVLRTGVSTDGLEVRFFPDGLDSDEEDMKWVHCKGSVVDYEGDKAVMLAMVDVTKVKDMEKVMQLREKMASLGHVAAGIAHEIRNPLSGINVLMDGIEENFQEPGSVEDIKMLIREVQKASNKIESIIKRVLDFAKPGQPQLKKMDINAPIREALELTKTTLRKAGVSIESDLAHDLPHLYIDSQLIEGVILNLINNAAEAMRSMEKEKWIKVISWRADSDICISVSDSGPGVPDKISKKIFDPFYTSKPDGSGIGLSFCQRVVTDHNGTITLFSRLKGGAIFRIKLPLDKRVLYR